MAQEETTKAALAPFDRSDADLILRTSDGVDFRVDTHLLKLASSVFEDMFMISTHPGPSLTASLSSASTESVSSESSLPIVQVTESSTIFDIILRIIYPVSTPKVTDWGTICDVLEVGSKYQMEAVATQMGSELSTHLLTNSSKLKVYAIACQFQLEDVAREAATTSTPRTHTQILKDIKQKVILAKYISCMTAGQLFRFIWYQEHSSQPDVLKEGSGYTFTYKGDYNGIKPINSLPDRDHVVSLDIDSDIFSSNKADIILRTCDQQDFPSHRLILTIHSPVFLEMLSSPNSPTGDLAGPGVLEVPEDSSTISLILKIVYCIPLPAASLCRIDTLSRTVQALKKYKIDRMVERAKMLFLDESKVHALEAYFVSIACGWEEEAVKAAKKILCHNSINELYVTQMEKSSARAYQRLLAYHSHFLEQVQSNIPNSVQENGSKLDVVTAVMFNWNNNNFPALFQEIRTNCYTIFQSNQVDAEAFVFKPIKDTFKELSDRVKTLRDNIGDIKLNDIMTV
ncbi:hypothetical protein ABKN59_010996 [Abortiporus biennis]